MKKRPKVGTVQMIILPGDIKRKGEVLAYNDDMVLIHWIGYPIPDGWILAEHLSNG